MRNQSTFLELMEESQFEGFALAADRARKGGQQFQESFTRFLKLINNKHMGKYAFGHALQEAATTSDFPTLLGTVLDVTMVAAYKSIPASLTDWKSYIGTGSQSDFRPSKLVKSWGLDTPLGRVPEMGEYPEGKKSEGFTGIALAKFGKAFGVSFESIVNDRLGLFTDAASDLARGAARSELRFATSMYATPTGPNALLYGAPIAHSLDKANVTNKYTVTPLTSDNLALAIANIRNQVDVNGEPIFFEKVHVVVAPANEMNLKRILSPAAIVVNSAGVGAGAKPTLNTSENILNQYSITPHVNPYLPIIDTSGGGNTTWYVFVDKNDAPAAWVNFLRGHETPETFMKASNQTSVGGGDAGAMNGSFEDDTIWWKVRHIFGGAALDQRATGAYIAA